ncbi:MAG: 5'/3'-nucleotidase SurE [Anaerolineae bacterium]
MDTSSRPLLVLTNDDGIHSPGLAALARALQDLGDIMIAAPLKQQSGVGRSLTGSGVIEKIELDLGFEPLAAYAVEGTPALAVRTAVIALAPRPISLVVSGINYGENIGVGITVSGTLGAAIEAAGYGLLSLAISLETDVAQHFTHSNDVDFTMAGVFSRRAVLSALRSGFPPGVDVLKLDIPCDADPTTSWRFTRLTRQRYFESTLIENTAGYRQIKGYERLISLDDLEADSDARTLLVDRQVSVCPLTIDLSALHLVNHLDTWQPL